jgi:hypothetical protein
MLPSNGDVFTGPLPRNGRSLHSHRLATDVYTTIVSLSVLLDLFVQWLVLLPRVREGQGSNFIPDDFVILHGPSR